MLGCFIGRSKEAEGVSSVILVACGSFNPPTVAHLRVFELIRQEFYDNGVDVLGAYMSPVNDKYYKPNLIEGEHRLEMCRLATKQSGEHINMLQFLWLVGTP